MDDPLFPDWQRTTILTIAGFIVAFSLFSLYAAAVQWAGLPSNLVVLLYFLLVLVVVPALAVRAFMLAWQGRSPGLAAVLTAIPAVILLLRTVLVGGM